MSPSFRKDNGAFAAAHAWEDEEGFHISIELWSGSGSKKTIGQKLAATKVLARAWIDAETARFGFAAGECHLVVEKVRAKKTS